MSTNQTGHEQNVVNVGVMNHRIKTFRSGYNPSRIEFTVSSLEQLKSNGEEVISSWTFAENVFKKSTSDRTSAFTGFNSLITRSVNTVRISGVSAQTIDQAEAMVRELRGTRASVKLTDAEIAAAKENGEELKNNTKHNSTIDSKIENFKKYVLFLSMEDKYIPNETDLKIEALNNKLLLLQTANDNYTSAKAALNAARLVRDTMLYASTTGLVDIALGVKLYVKSSFGATSPEYKSISDINFRKLKSIPNQITQIPQER